MSHDSHGTEKPRADCNAAVDRRQVEEARRDAEDSLIRYAAALSWWNAPDDEHTRIQLRGLIEDVIATMPGGTS